MAAQKITAQTAVESKIIGNQTLAYFMARTQLFLIKCGIIEAKLRFRQHKGTEMAHYASDWSGHILRRKRQRGGEQLLLTIDVFFSCASFFLVAGTPRF